MAFKSSILMTLSLMQCLPLLCVGQDFDFFCFVVTWPGSYCDTKKSCCYPTTGKAAADFSIHGLWPNYNDGSYPKICDPNSPYDESLISDLISRMQQSWPTLSCPSANGSEIWSHEWGKHGTCSEAVLDQCSYFVATLHLTDQVDILQILENAGIRPNNGKYNLYTIVDAIEFGIGYTPGIRCKVDAFGNSHVYEKYVCVDTSASNFIPCPVLPKSNCASSVELPPFGQTSAELRLHDV